GCRLAWWVWVPRILSRPLTWCLCRASGRQVRYPAARRPHVQALPVPMSLRFACLAVLRTLGWLALLARSEGANEAGILILRQQVAVAQRRARAPRLSWADRALLTRWPG